MVDRAKDTQARKAVGIGRFVRDLFVSKGELCPAGAYRALKGRAHKTSYPAVLRLFYDLRQLSLIEFTRSEEGRTPIDRRYHRIVPGKENDPCWQSNPHHLLYPDSAVGGLYYREGTSRGRDKKYAKRNNVPDPGAGKPAGGSLPEARRQAAR